MGSLASFHALCRPSDLQEAPDTPGKDALRPAAEDRGYRENGAGVGTRVLHDGGVSIAMVYVKMSRESLGFGLFHSHFRTSA